MNPRCREFDYWNFVITWWTGGNTHVVGELGAKNCVYWEDWWGLSAPLLSPRPALKSCAALTKSLNRKLATLHSSTPSIIPAHTPLCLLKKKCLLFHFCWFSQNWCCLSKFLKSYCISLQCFVWHNITFIVNGERMRGGRVNGRAASYRFSSPITSKPGEKG